ncbi:helix-turn-helix domain-containing protein [Alkanindiges hydrocarboniclasticus]|uniref:helix-turn-helix domain-containing protein n=1 Tax=Alkanindiges hydrocarboniclasticus TaxID=1907941 RepID=UPI003872C3D3
MSTKAQREIAHRSKIFAHAKQSGNIVFTCRYFGISRDTFYRLENNYQTKGESELINTKPRPENPKLRKPVAIEEKIFICVSITILGR